MTRCGAPLRPPNTRYMRATGGGRALFWRTYSSESAAVRRTPTGVAGLLLLYAGRLDEAREKLTAIRQRAIDRGDESDLAFFLCWLAWLETLAGHLDAAQMYADEAALAATLTNSKSMLSFA